MSAYSRNNEKLQKGKKGSKRKIIDIEWEPGRMTQNETETRGGKGGTVTQKVK